MNQPFEEGSVNVDGYLYEASRAIESGKVWYYKGSRTIRANKRIAATFKVSTRKA